MHCISFLIYPLNTCYEVFAKIQAFLSITSLPECINIISSKIYFCYLYCCDKEQYKEKKYIVWQIIISWTFPIIYGILCVLYGDIKQNYTLFSWVSNTFFVYSFSCLFGIAFIIGLIFSYKIHKEMKSIVRETKELSNSNEYKSLIKRIRINYIELLLSFFVFTFDSINYLILFFVEDSESLKSFQKLDYLLCIVDNLLVASFCFYFGYKEPNKRNGLRKILCSKKKEKAKSKQTETEIINESFNSL